MPVHILQLYNTRFRVPWCSLCCFAVHLHAACLQHGRSSLAEGNSCPALLALGRSPATSALGLCTITCKGERQQAEGRKTPSEFLSGIWSWLTVGGKKKKADTLSFYSRPSVGWQEQSAPDRERARLHAPRQCAQAPLQCWWGGSKPSLRLADCCVQSCVNGTVCTPRSASNISTVCST